MLRSCYSSTWNLPGEGQVEGQFYFSPEGTPFLPDLSWLGSRNWHSGDGTPWPEFGEIESARQTWRNGAWPGPGNPPLPKRIGEVGCLEAEAPELVQITWRGGLPATCFVEDQDMPIGMIVGYAGSVLPPGWLDCDGAAVSRVFYGELFAAIGTTWGVGDGVNTFNLPDLRSRTIFGVGQGVGLSAYALASQGGEESHVLTVAEMPGHTHTTSITPTAPGYGPGAIMGQLPNIGANTGSTGGDTAHPQIPPYRGAHWIIRAA